MRSTPAGIVAGAIALACALSAPAVHAAQGPSRAELTPTDDGRALESPLPAPQSPVAWAQALGSVPVDNANSGKKGSVQLYRADGSLDADALRAFSTLACDADEPLDSRLVRLAIKAAYHFGAKEIVVISAFRAGPRGGGGKHATHEALDFRLRGVASSLLAAHLRSYPRVGVGIYTHPKTQYVHLDVRDQSFHWLDASPPGRTWREAELPDKARVIRDASYTSESDLPERARP